MTSGYPSVAKIRCKARSLVTTVQPGRISSWLPPKLHLQHLSAGFCGRKHISTCSATKDMQDQFFSRFSIKVDYHNTFVASFPSLYACSYVLQGYTNQGYTLSYRYEASMYRSRNTLGMLLDKTATKNVRELTDLLHRWRGPGRSVVYPPQERPTPKRLSMLNNTHTTNTHLYFSGIFSIIKFKSKLLIVKLSSHTQKVLYEKIRWTYMRSRTFRG